MFGFGYTLIVSVIVLSEHLLLVFNVIVYVPAL